MKCGALIGWCLMFLACVGPPPPPERGVTWRALGSWRGQGNRQLETFPIQGGTLRLHWDATSPPGRSDGWLKVRVQSGDSGRVLAEPIDVRGAGRDTVSFSLEHHRVYLTVESANLDWSISAEEATAPRPLTTPR
jgi:hypothetical protein